MEISVHGLGHIGLPTAALFASAGLEVIGVDISPNVVGQINLGAPHTTEPGLSRLTAQVVASGHLRAVNRPRPASAHIICVPTPIDAAKAPDLGPLRAAIATLAPVLRPGDLVVIESTIPPRATERVGRWIADLRPDLADAIPPIAYCPERAIPSAALREIARNDRIIGGLCPEGATAAARLYGRICTGHLHLTDARTAELCKLAENSWRDVSIAYANELSLICEGQGVDVWRLIELANHHPRVAIPRPGPGVGGHCIAVDPWFLAGAAPDDSGLITAARRLNDVMPRRTAERILARLGPPNAPQRIACLGLAYKPDVDDLRESPALEVAALLAEAGHEVLSVDPHLSDLPVELLSRGVRLVSLDHALAEARAICALVGHSAFDRRRVEIARHPLVIDTVGLLRGAFGDGRAIGEAGGRIEDNDIPFAKAAEDLGMDTIAMTDLDRHQMCDPRIDPKRRPGAVFAEERAGGRKEGGLFAPANDPHRETVAVAKAHPLFGRAQNIDDDADPLLLHAQR